MDMSDVVQEQCQDPQSSQHTQPDEIASLKCTYNGCESKESFLTKAALKYVSPQTTNFYHANNIPESTKTNTPVHTPAPKPHAPKHLSAIKPVSSATNEKCIAPQHPLSSVLSAPANVISAVFIGNTTFLNTRNGGTDSVPLPFQRSLQNEKILRRTSCLRMVKKRRRGCRLRTEMKR
jgi:hypothetical protein